MLKELGMRAREATVITGALTTEEKNRALQTVAEGLVKNSKTILAANEQDMANGREKGMSAGLLDRLKLTEERIVSMAVAQKQQGAGIEQALLNKLKQLAAETGGELVAGRANVVCEMSFDWKKLFEK